MTPEVCPNRLIVGLLGKDCLTFLQSLVSNDVRPLGLADGLIWTALLTPQGKYLADFFVGRLNERLFLDLPGQLADGIMQRLTMYKLRAEVTFEPLDWQVGRGLGAAPTNSLPDPRTDALGWRSYGMPTVPGSTDWNALRVQNMVPETGIELISNESYVLEMGFERLHGVDFRKGCYVGQEVTARMKHKTELRKGLVQVRVQGSAPVGTPIMNDGKEAGTLYSQSGNVALAYLRFDRAEGSLTAGEAIITWDGAEA